MFFLFPYLVLHTPLHSYCLYIPWHGLVKIWRNSDILKMKTASLAALKRLNMCNLLVSASWKRLFVSRLRKRGFSGSFALLQTLNLSFVSISSVSRLNETIREVYKKGWQLSHLPWSHFCYIFSVSFNIFSFSWGEDINSCISDLVRMA